MVAERMERNRLLAKVPWVPLLVEQVFFNRDRHQKSSMKKGVLKNFAKFTGKHLY